MREFGSLDLYLMLKELKFLVGAKIEKIYQDRDDFIFSFHKGGKHLLKIEPGKIYLASFKDFDTEPKNFCMFLRKYIGQARLRKIEQKNFERIVEFHIENKEKYILIVELFNKGNLILCDKNYKILYPLHSKRFKDRAVKKGKKYVYPPPIGNFDNFKLTDKNLVRTLASGFGFGGIYAEEICFRANIDKTSTKLTKEQTNKIKKIIDEILKLKIKANEVNREVYPFELKSIIGERKYFDSFSKSLDSYESFDNPYSQKIKKVMKIIEKQREQVENLKRKSEENKRKGDLIYLHYSEIKELLDSVKEMRDKKISFEEIGRKLKKEIKHGKLLLDLE